MGITLRLLKKEKWPLFRKEVTELASQFSLEVDFERPDTKLVRFKRDSVRIDVWQSGTVGIYEHGNQKFLKHVSRENLVELFANPNVTL